MIDKVKFIEDIKNLLSSGMSDKDVISYIKSLGFSDKETKEFMLEVKKTQNKKSKLDTAN